MPTLPGRHEHSVRVAQVLEKLEGATVDLGGPPKPEEQAAAPEPKPEPTANVAAEPSAEEQQATAAPEPAKTEDKPKPEGRASDRIARSVQLERRAQAAQEKAKEAGRRRQEDEREAERQRKLASDRMKRAEAAERKVAQEASAVQRELRQLQLDPVGWMRAHGVSGADIAEYVKSGANPTTRRIEMLETRMGQMVEQVTKDYEKKLAGLQARIEEDRAEAAHQAFFDHVASDQDRFEAMNTIYSQSELLAKANKLAERNQRLHLGWDADRLCEELEAEARKDPRWGRVTARYEKKTTQTPKTKPNDPGSIEPNARPRDKGEAAEERQPQRAARRTESPEQNGLYRVSPGDRHRARVERIIRTTRFGV